MDSSREHKDTQGLLVLLALITPLVLLVMIFLMRVPEPAKPDPQAGIPDGKVELEAGPAESVEIPDGWFVMGCAAGDLDCEPDEIPARNVHLSAFRIDKTEVTVERYALCVKGGACTPPAHGPGCNYGVAGRDAHPINCVSESQARAFCESIGQRLPTEAEWERAARSDRSRRFPWGDQPPSCERAVMNDGRPGCGAGTTAAVCARPAGNSAEGLCDLAGNVWEYVNDAYLYEYHRQTGREDPKVPAFHEARGLRGGSYLEGDARIFRGSRRQEQTPDIPLAARGFRCARPVKNWSWDGK